MKAIKEALQKLPFRTHSWIAGISCLIGCVLMWVGAQSGEAYIWIFVIGILLLILTVIYSILAFRCPHCDTWFGTRGGMPNYCPYCGKEIEK